MKNSSNFIKLWLNCSYRLAVDDRGWHKPIKAYYENQVYGIYNKELCIFS